MKIKIKEILNIKIDYTHILFILLKSIQNKETIKYLKKYKIPFIFYDINSNCFINDNYENISSFFLDSKTSYIENYENWENSLKEDSIKNNENEVQSEEEIEENEEFENNNINEQDEISEGIIYNKDIL